LMFLISTAICFAICRFLPKKVKWISVALIFAMTLGFYIQGNFLASGYPLLDGEEIPWHKLTSKGIVSIIVWVIIMAICFVLMFLKKNIFKNVVKVLSALILTIQIITLTFLCFTTEMPFGEKTYLSIVEEFNLSSEENIIVFVADTFEAGHMERAINEFPELKEQLKDFTFFKNTTGVGPFTYLSMVTFLSNEIFPVGKGYYAGLRESIDKSTFYEEMHEVGYDVNYYTESGFIHGKCKDKVDNLEIAESSFNIKVTGNVASQLYKLSFFKYMPHHLKKPFVIDTNEFNETEEDMDYPVYVFDDLDFHKRMMDKGIKSKRDKKQYVLYHLNGLHAPLKFDRNLNEVEYPEEVTFNERRYEQALGEIKILGDYIKQLKEKGIYDKSTIVYTTDHGNVDRYNTVFMVKPAGEDSEFKMSNAPISLAEDFVPFILDTAKGKGKSAALYNIPEDMKRERYVYNFYANEYAGENLVRSKIAVNGPANEAASYKIISDEFMENKANVNKYTFGNKIKFAYNTRNAKVYGVGENGNVIGRTAKVELHFKNKVDKDLRVKVDIKAATDKDQKLIIKSGEHILYDAQVSPETTEIVFSIPKHIAKREEQFTLDFECPDTTRRDEDTAGLEWLMYDSFCLKNMFISDV